LTTRDCAKRARIHSINDAGDRVRSWSAWHCLSGQLIFGGTTYVLDDGAILEVAQDYLTSLNQFIDAITPSAIQFPQTPLGTHEDVYNRELADHLAHAILLDRIVLAYKGTSPIEVCDVALQNRKLIHVKRGTSSAALSHLFSQAAVSAELLHMDSHFRQRIAQRLEQGVEGSGGGETAGFGWLHGAPFEPSTCEIICVIMSGKPAPVAASSLLPFFSKVNLRMRCV